jgi:CDP-diacylglycerol---serine O-phosphatidyltransferase
MPHALHDRISPEAANYVKYALPNGVTIMALFFGLTALTYAADHQHVRAIACVLIAGLLDACDGRVARTTGAASKFGAELDSLADVVCFGAVPAFIVHDWGLAAYGSLGWLSCLIFAAACALRLARFNVTAADVNQPSWASQYFTGVPAPAGAFLALAPLYATNAGVLDMEGASRLALFQLPLVAALMVSTWPSFSAKAISRKALRLWFIPSMMLAALMIFGLIAAPWLTLCAAAIAYLLSLPLSKFRHRRAGTGRRRP